MDSKKSPDPKNLHAHDYLFPDLSGSECCDNNPIVELERQSTTYRAVTRAVISSVVGNEKILSEVLYRVAPQVDELLVYLNGRTRVPKECRSVPENVKFFTGPDMGDRGKLLFLKGYTGYYITLCETVSYPLYYVSNVLAGIEKYARKSIVGWKGYILDTADESESRTANSTDCLVLADPTIDTSVQLLDTSTAAFHTDTLAFKNAELDAYVNAELFLAEIARQQSVSLIALAHDSTAIDQHSSGSELKSSFPYGAKLEQSLVQRLPASGSQLTFSQESISDIHKPRVSIIGRANAARWKKGGILKSVLLTKDMLTSHGCQVELIDIVDHDVYQLNSPDVLMVYVGDPERPDFKKVHRLVEFHAEKGIPILVNLSEDGFYRRTREISKVMNEWRRRFHGRVSMMTFSHNVDSKVEYESFRDAIVPLPKTLTFAHKEYAEYETTGGIFIGDVAKLSDSRIVGEHVQYYLRSLRAALPEAPIYGLQQYKSKYKVPAGIDEVWPFMSAQELAQRLAKIRLMVSFPKFATYEMVPVEASAMGVPLLYQDMPQSLNESVGTAGIRYRDSFELVNSAQVIYRDSQVWRQLSIAGIQRARSQQFDVASAHMYLTIKNFVERYSRNRI